MSVTNPCRDYFKKSKILNKYGDHYFILFSNCIPTKGISRSIIADLQRHTFEFVSNELVDLLELFKRRKIKHIYESTALEDFSILDSYFQLLIDKEYIYLTLHKNEIKNFPDIVKNWDNAAHITNAIIDFTNTQISIKFYNKFLEQLSKLGCLYLQVRYFGPASLVFHYEGLLDLICNLNFISVELIVQAPCSKDDTFRISELFVKYPKLASLIMYNASENFVENFETSVKPFRGRITYTSDLITDDSTCGAVSPCFFSINLEMFFESQQYNNCLNRKISLDKYGYIKNCPSMQTSYGHIGTSFNLEGLIKRSEFNEIWAINKDQISGCKNCEFRYICTDCRVKVTSALSKPTTCSYNPERCIWE